MEGRRGNGAALAVLAALVLFLFRDAVFLGQSLFERDIHAYWGPQVASLVRSIAAGSPTVIALIDSWSRCTASPAGR